MRSVPHEKSEDVIFHEYVQNATGVHASHAATFQHYARFASIHIHCDE